MFDLPSYFLFSRAPLRPSSTLFFSFYEGIRGVFIELKVSVISFVTRACGLIIQSIQLADWIFTVFWFSPVCCFFFSQSPNEVCIKQEVCPSCSCFTVKAFQLFRGNHLFSVSQVIYYYILLKYCGALNHWKHSQIELRSRSIECFYCETVAGRVALTNRFGHQGPNLCLVKSVGCFFCECITKYCSRNN